MLDFLQVDPVAFRLPFWPFEIFWYGIVITLGIFLAALWGSREIEKRGQSADELINGLLVVVLAGYVFARGWYVLQDILANGRSYTFVEAINLRAGGANILGGFIGAVLVGALYIRWRKLPFWTYADVAGPALLLAQAVGRWGNFINQELYGPPTDRPWGILIDPERRIAPYNDLTLYPPETRFHPAFLYESILLLLGFIVLVYLSSRFREAWKSGTIFGLFLIWWGAGRAVVEFFRPDQPRIGDSVVSYSMLLAIGIALAGVLVLLNRYGRLPVSGRARRRRRRARKPRPRRSS